MQISSIKIIRQKLLSTLSISHKIFNPDKEVFCKKILTKHKISEKIIKYTSNDINTKRYFNTKEILSELRLLIIYFINNNFSFSKFGENILPLFNKILDKYLKIDNNFNKSFYEFIEEINTFNKAFQIKINIKYII